MAAVCLKTPPTDLHRVVKVTIWVTAQVETERASLYSHQEKKTISDSIQTAHCEDPHSQITHTIIYTESNKHTEQTKFQKAVIMYVSDLKHHKENPEQKLLTWVGQTAVLPPTHWPRYEMLKLTHWISTSSDFLLKYNSCLLILM